MSSHGAPANDVNIGKPRQQAPHTEKAFFGTLKQDTSRQQHSVSSDDYEERFTEDAYCEETAPNARVWRTYVEEAAAFDAIMIGQSRDGLDVMLVFAGLFSAVVMSFLVQVSQKLEADFSQMSAILMHDLVLIQLSMAAGSSAPNLTAPSVDPTSSFTPDTITVWINGLWAVSLVASLVVALAAVLVKQWLHHYTSLPSGTPGTRSHIRQYRFMGLEKWRVSMIIGLLPIIMNISLTLFFVGLILFFVPLQASLASVIGVITFTVTVLYFVSSAMPIFYPQCPYQTPLTDFAYYAFLAASSMRQYFTLTAHKWTNHKFRTRKAARESSRARRKSSISLSDLETRAVEEHYDMLSVDALDWLFNVSSNPSVHSVVVQSLGGLPDSVHPYTEEKWRDQDEMRRVRQGLFVRSARTLVKTPFRPSGELNTYSLTCAVGCESVCDRLNRSLLFLPRRPDHPVEACYKLIDDGRDDLHLGASRWLTVRARSKLLDDATVRTTLRTFISTHHGVKLHRLVWVHLLELAIFCAVLAPEHLDDSIECATVIALCFDAALRTTLDLARNRDRVKGIIMSLGNVLKVQTTLYDHRVRGGRKDLAIVIQDCLLQMLSTYDSLPPSFSSSHRLVLAVGKFGVSHVVRYFSAHRVDFDGWRHLSLVGGALDHLYDIIRKDFANHALGRVPEEQVFVQAIIQFLISVIDTTPVGEYRVEYWENNMIKNLFVRCLRRTVQLCEKFLESHFSLPAASLERLFRVATQHLSVDLGIWRPAVSPPDLNRTTDDILKLLSFRLVAGEEFVFRAFVAGDWLKPLSESWLVDLYNLQHYTRPVFGSSMEDIMHNYVHGLSVLPLEVRGDLVEYIYKPRNLFMVLLILAMELRTVNRAQGMQDVRALFAFCPGHASWAECHATVKGLIAWGRDPQGVGFPLEGFFGGRVVSLHDVEVSLDEEWRLLLGYPGIRADLELAEECICDEASSGRVK